jgi:hypothetical protein
MHHAHMLQAFEELVRKILETPTLLATTLDSPTTVKVDASKTAMGKSAASACAC